MVNPVLFVGEKAAYLAHLLTRKREKKLSFFLLAAIAGVSAYFLLGQTRIYNRTRLLANQQTDALGSVKTVYVAKLNDMKCDVCDKENKQIVFKPCSHLALCKACHHRNNTLKCPRCNGFIHEAIEIYLS